MPVPSIEEWEATWKKYLSTRRFPRELPRTTIINLGEDVDFYIPPVMATTPEGFRALQRHNAKLQIF